MSWERGAARMMTASCMLCALVSELDKDDASSAQSIRVKGVEVGAGARRRSPGGAAPGLEQALGRLCHGMVSSRGVEVAKQEAAASVFLA